MNSYQKEFKVLHTIYKIILIILFLFAAFIFYQKKTVFSVSNFIFSDYLILVSLTIGLLIIFGVIHFYNLFLNDSHFFSTFSNTALFIHWISFSILSGFSSSLPTRSAGV